MSDSKTVLTVKEVAKILRLSRNSIYEAVRRGDIGHLRIGNRILIPHVALEALLTGTGNICIGEHPNSESDENTNLRD